jgi:nucleoside 2-deoxyribosyltransferase
MRIYMAGPLFTTAETLFNAELARELRHNGHFVFLPQDFEQNVEFDPRAVFLHDVGGIDWCQLVLANMDGPDQDSGTCWELGYAYAKDK